jgi:hypoxanthine phosphoribosyltransferase
MRVSDAPAGAPSEVGGLLLSTDEIRERIAELASDITAAHEGQELVVVTVLRGGLYFLSDLCRALPDPLRIDFMAITSYGSLPHPGGVRITKDLDENIEGKHVLLVEDIIDTGLTLNYLLGVLRSRKPASLDVAVLLDRDQRRIADVPIKYRGFHMPDVFAVGYGLDLYGRFRNLPYLGVLREEAFEPIGLA